MFKKKLGNIYNIWEKELRETLRDKRTLFIMTLLPILLYPMLMLGMIQLIAHQLGKINKENVTIVIEGNSPKVEALLKQQSFNVEKTNIAWEDVYNEKATLGLKIPANFDKIIEKSQEIPRILIYYSGANEKARLLLRKLQNTLHVYLYKTKKQILQNQPPGFERPFSIMAKNIAGAKKQGAFEFGRILALLVVLMAITFPLYPAIDMGAGEKERGTMETLLVSPATRLEIVLGKYLAIFSIAIVGSLLNLASMGITFSYFTQQSNSLIKAGQTQQHQNAEDFQVAQAIENDYSPIIKDGKISQVHFFTPDMILTFDNELQKIAIWHIDAEKIVYEAQWNLAAITDIVPYNGTWLASTENGLVVQISFEKEKINVRRLWETTHNIKKLLLNNDYKRLLVTTENHTEFIDTDNWKPLKQINEIVHDTQSFYLISRQKQQLMLVNTETGKSQPINGYNAIFLNDKEIAIFAQGKISIMSILNQSIFSEVNTKNYIPTPVTTIQKWENKILIGCENGLVQLWEYQQRKMVFHRYLGTHDSKIVQLDMQENHFLSLDEEGVVKKWSVAPKLTFSLSGTALLSMFILLIPLVAMFSALCLGLSIFARSYKEGQHYLTPMVIVVMPLVMVAFLPNMSLSLGFCFVPVSNIVLLYKEMFIGNATLMQGVLVFSSMMVYALISLKWAIYLFNREDVIFRQVDGIQWNFFRKNKQQVFDVKEVLVFFTATLIAFQFISARLSSNLLFAQSLGMVLFLAATPFALVTAFRYNIPNMFFLKDTFPLKKLPCILLIGVASFIFSIVLFTIQNSIIDTSNEELSKLFTSLMAQKPLWLLIVVFAILPGICEELFFRGFVLRNLRSKMDDNKAIIWTAFLFAVMHVDVTRFSFTFAMGIFLGMLLVKTGNILVPIIVHAMCNSISISFGHYDIKPGTDLHLVYTFIIENQILVTCCAITISAILLTKGFRWLGDATEKK